MTLTEFLLARIAEDERAAASSGLTDQIWEAVRDGEGVYVVGLSATIAENVNLGYEDHIARHDPARVQAECKAKRLIIERAESVSADPGWVQVEGDAILAALALPYADHPDYNPEWWRLY